MVEKVLVIGLGSMGKRRIRNLREIGIVYIKGFDIRDDRCSEVTEKYAVETFTDYAVALQSAKFDAFIISVPPDKHEVYMFEALKLGIPAFIEASVIDESLDAIIKMSKEKEVLLAPSCTLLFHPAIKKIRSLIDSKELGKISNVIYHSGQYLPDWHTYEDVSEYYVSNKETGGAREIVPFELSWITKVFGFPERVAGMYKKTIQIKGAEAIDDTYSAIFDFGDHLFFLTVDVVSRFGTRRLTINGDQKQLFWDWDEALIKLYNPSESRWEVIQYSSDLAESGYNKNITEQMYVEEIRNFLAATANTSLFANSLEDDKRILNLLYSIERSCDTSRHIVV